MFSFRGQKNLLLRQQSHESSRRSKVVIFCFQYSHLDCERNFEQSVRPLSNTIDFIGLREGGLDNGPHGMAG